MATPLDNLKEKELKNLSEALHHLIDHIDRRIQYAESRRTGITAIAAAMLAADVALLTFGQTTVKDLSFWVGLIAFSVTGILLSAVIWITYARQTNFDYPFKPVTAYVST